MPQKSIEDNLIQRKCTVSRQEELHGKVILIRGWARLERIDQTPVCLAKDSMEPLKGD